MATDRNNLNINIKITINEAVNDLRNLIKELKGLGDSLSGLNIKVVNNTKVINDNRSAVKDNSKTINNLTQNINSNNTSVNKNNDLLKNNTLAYAGLTAVIYKLVDSFKQLGTTASNAFIEFDKQLRNVNSLAQLSEKSFQGLSKEVINLTDNSQIKEGATGLTKAMYQLVSSGFDVAEALEMAGVASKAASAGMTNTETAVTGLSALMNAYNEKTLQDSIDYSDKLFKVVDKGVISFEQLTANLGTVAATASAAKVPFNDVGAAFISLTRAGINASESETAINNLIRAIIDPSKEASETAKKLGIDLNAIGLESLGLEGIMKQLATATGGNVDILAKLIPEARAFKAAATLAKDETRVFSEALGFMAQSGGSTQKALSQQSKAIAFDIEKLNQSIENLQIEFGKLLAESFHPFIADIKEIIRYVRLLDDDTKKSIINVGIWATAIGGLGIALSGLIFIFKPFIGLVIGLATVQLPALIAGWGSFISLLEASAIFWGTGGALALGLGIIGAAFITLAGAIWTLKEAWDWWMAATKSEMDWKEIKNQVNGAKDVIQDFNKVLRSKDGLKSVSITDLEKYKKAFVSAITTSTKGEQDIYRRTAIEIKKEIDSRKELDKAKKASDKEQAKAIADRARANFNLNTAEKDKAKNEKTAIDEKAKKIKEAYDKEFRLIENKRELNKQSELKGNLSPDQALSKEIELLNQESNIYTRIANDKKIIDQSYKDDSTSKALAKQTEILRIQKDLNTKTIKEKLDMTDKAFDRSKQLLDQELKNSFHTEKQKTDMIIAENKRKIEGLKKIAGLPGVDPETSKKINDDIFKLEQENQDKRLALKVSTAQKEKALVIDTNKFLQDTYKEILTQDQDNVSRENSINEIKYRNNLISFQEYIKNVESLGEIEQGIFQEIADSELYNVEERKKARYDLERSFIETNNRIMEESQTYLNSILDRLTVLSGSENKVLDGIGDVATKAKSMLNEVLTISVQAVKASAGDIGSIVSLSVKGIENLFDGFDNIIRLFTGRPPKIIEDTFDKLAKGIFSFSKEIQKQSEIIIETIAKQAEEVRKQVTKITETIEDVARKANEKSYNLEKKALEIYYDDRLEAHNKFLKDQGKLNKEEIEDRIKSEKQAIANIKKSREELLSGRKEDQAQAQKDYKSFIGALASTKSGLGADFYRSNALDSEENTGSLKAKDQAIQKAFSKGEISVSEFRTKKAEQSLLRYAYLEDQLNKVVDPKERLDKQQELDSLMKEYFELYRDSDLEALDRQEQKAKDQLSNLESIYEVEKSNVENIERLREESIKTLDDKYMTSAGVYKDYFVQSTSNWVDDAKIKISGITSGLKAELNSTSAEFNKLQEQAKADLNRLQNQRNFAGIDTTKGVSKTVDPFSLNSYLGNNTTNNTSSRVFNNSPSISVTNNGAQLANFHPITDVIKRLTSDFNRIAGK